MSSGAHSRDPLARNDGAKKKARNSRALQMVLAPNDEA